MSFRTILPTPAYAALLVEAAAMGGVCAEGTAERQRHAQPASVSRRTNKD